MKQATSLLVALAFCIGCTAQQPMPVQGEVGVLPNDCKTYLYPDSTMYQLRHIVDSLNLRYKSCDLRRSYLSQWQGKAHFVSLEKGNIRQAEKDLEAGMGLEAFLRKYPAATLQKDLLVLLATHEEDNDSTVAFRTIALDRKYEHFFSMDRSDYMAHPSLKGKWVFDYTPKSEYLKESLEALLFTTDLQQKELPQNYAQLIGYADCLVDTTATVYLTDAEDGWGFAEREANAIDSFLQYMGLKLKEPRYDDTSFDSVAYERFQKKHDHWEKHIKLRRADSLFAYDAVCSTLFQAALTTALEKGGSDDALEEWVERYAGPATALQLKRERRVVGMCSMDSRPIHHAANIARLSAATVNWEVFLRSHLDILNDRFERQTDGSYAWEGRATYLPELEALNINVLDLLLGISLRYDHASENHYWGSIRRVGRALSETSQPEAAEAALLAAIGDSSLDDYNRVLFYYLYANYAHHKYVNEQKEFGIRLEAAAAQKLPAHLAATYQ
jgi:hypothetical protein